MRIKDKDFEEYISAEEIRLEVTKVAERLNGDYAGTSPVMLCVLNGAFVFAADLARRLTFTPEMVFAKFSSYAGTESTGEVKELIGVGADICGRDVIVVEDIVDTGTTMGMVIPMLKAKGAKSVRLCTLLLKPDSLRAPVCVDYCAFEIPNDFVVGYGLDYDGMGRELPQIMKVKGD